MVGSVDVERALPGQILRAFSISEWALDLGRMIEDRRVTVALQNLVVHTFVAGSVPAFPRGCVHENFAFRHARFRVEKELTALQFEGAMNCVKTTPERPTNVGLCRIEHDLHTAILRRRQLTDKDDERREEACPGYFSQCPSPLCQKPQTQRGRVPKQEIPDRPRAKMHSEQMCEELWLG